MNLFYDDVMVGRRQDGSPIYAKDLRAQLGTANETIRRNEGRRLFELCVQHGAKPGHVLAWLKTQLAQAAHQTPEGFALVPVEVKRDAERYQWLCRQAAEDSGSVFMDRAISQLSEWVTPKHEIDSTIDAAPKGDSHE